MKSRHSQSKIVLLAACLLAWGASSAYAGVSRVIQERYRKNYENKALFLKIPIFSEKRYVYIIGQSFRNDLTPAGTSPRFKVGDQLRVLGLDFGGDEIKFKLGVIAGPTTVELVFKFDGPLQENFPNSGVFDKALAATFTEGLKYTDLDDAKRTYIEQEFDRVTREIATSSGTNRDTVLKYVAPQLPAYQDALHEIENLQNKNQELSKQVAQGQAENRKLDLESKNQQAEIVRLRNQTKSLQEKIDSSTSQLLKLNEDLLSAKGVSQSYQRELANLERSLKIRVDPNRDLASQIAGLGQVMQRIQKENDDLQGENASLRSYLEKEQADNVKLSGENQDLKNSVRQKDDTIKTLTSKEDSLARQYFLLKQTKDNLENVALSVSNLNTHVMEEKTEGGVQFGKIDAYLGDILLGSFEWRLPERMNSNQEKDGEASFSTESIDYIRVTPTERQIRQSLGERLKLRVSLVSRSDSMEVKPEKESTLQEVGERDRATWRWRILNRGTMDSRLLVTAQLVNKNGDAIPLIQAEELIASSNLVRQVRNYLQPIPLTLGAVLGSLLVCIAGLFRRVSHAGPARDQSLLEMPPGGRKQL
jgi:predicted  nucleic acid-binding Zn-ribbon protein